MSSNGSNPPPTPSERVDPPLYLARYLEAERANGEATPPADDGTPLYLRRFRDAGSGAPVTAPVEFKDRSLPMQQALTEDNRNKEISAPADAANTKVVNDVYLIRHGETQGYSTDSGLTPQGAWQAHTYGHTMAKRVKSGETVVLRHAHTNRARETAEQIHRGLLDGLEMFGKEVTIVEPDGMDEFRNFGFAAPDGIKDVTAAFRQYHAILEDFERSNKGERPLWLVEMDRFWRTQQGGADPIQHWLSIPMIHFEPPAMCVRRFWAGIGRLADEFPGARLAIATHSGPIRAFAVVAMGYDPGEPYNTEHVRAKLLEGRTSALIAYRNRVQDVRIPDPFALPAWSVSENWGGL